VHTVTISVHTVTISVHAVTISVHTVTISVHTVTISVHTVTIPMLFLLQKLIYSIFQHWQWHNYAIQQLHNTTIISKALLYFPKIWNTPKFENIQLLMKQTSTLEDQLRSWGWFDGVSPKILNLSRRCMWSTPEPCRLSPSANSHRHTINKQ
jgi:hypothetical protein